MRVSPGMEPVRVGLRWLRLLVDKIELARKTAWVVGMGRVSAGSLVPEIQRWVVKVGVCWLSVTDVVVDGGEEKKKKRRARDSDGERVKHCKLMLLLSSVRRLHLPIWPGGACGIFGEDRCWLGHRHCAPCQPWSSCRGGAMRSRSRHHSSPPPVTLEPTRHLPA